MAPLPYAVFYRQVTSAGSTQLGGGADSDNGRAIFERTTILDELRKALGKEAAVRSLEVPSQYAPVSELGGVVLLSVDSMAAPPAAVAHAVGGVPDAKRLCLLLSIVDMGGPRSRERVAGVVIERSECELGLAQLTPTIKAEDPVLKDVGYGNLHQGFRLVVEKRGRAAKRAFAAIRLVEACEWASRGVEDCFGWRRSSGGGISENCHHSQDLGHSKGVRQPDEMCTPPHCSAPTAGRAADLAEVFVALVSSEAGGFMGALIGLTWWHDTTINHLTAMADAGVAVGNGAKRGHCKLPIREVETRSALFFQPCADDSQNLSGKGELGVVACGVDDPQNIGSIYRLMSCFGVTSKLVLIHPDRGQRRDVCGHGGSVDDVGPDTPGFLELPHIAKKVASTAVGTQTLTGPASAMSLSEFLAMDSAETSPLVVLETATGAVNIRSFSFPRRCRIVVGSEGNGVSKGLLAALQVEERGDAILFVPLPGPHPSLNVASALCCALYEYRRHWPC